MQPKNRTIPLILGFVFFVVGGWSMVIYFPEFKHKSVFVIPVLLLITVMYVYLFTKWLINPNKFAQDQQAKIQKMETTPMGRVALAISYNSWTVDIQVFKFIFKKFSLFLPFLISILAIVAVIMIPLLSGFDGQLLKYFYNLGTPTVYIFPILILVYSLVGCAIYAFSYVWLGSLLRKKYLNIQEGPLAMVGRYFRLTVFIVLLSCTWFIMMLSFGGKRKSGNVLAYVVSTVSVGILSAFKLFVYTNLVRVSLGDEKSGFKDTYEFAKKDIYQMLRIWFGSGILVSSIFIICLIALAVLSKAGIVPGTMAVQNIVAPAFFISVILIFVFRAFAEQIGTFAVYLKDKSNVDILN